MDCRPLEHGESTPTMRASCRGVIRKLVNAGSHGVFQTGWRTPKVNILQKMQKIYTYIAYIHLSKNWTILSLTRPRSHEWNCSDQPSGAAWQHGAATQNREEWVGWRGPRCFPASRDKLWKWKRVRIDQIAALVLRKKLRTASLKFTQLRQSQDS